jgi:hypothetical protein
MFVIIHINLIINLSKQKFDLKKLRALRGRAQSMISDSDMRKRAVMERKLTLSIMSMIGNTLI